MNIDEIKTLLKSGDIAGAEAAAQKLLAAEPDNVRLLILYGTCRQLQSDEATFRDTYAAVKAALDGKKVELDAVTAEEWNRFKRLYQQLDQPELLRKGARPRSPVMMEYAVLATLIAAAVAVGAWLYGKEILQMISPSEPVFQEPGEINEHLYAGPVRDEPFKANARWTTDVSNECKGL